MGTNPAPTANSSGTPVASLWQAPMFVFGVFALVGVWFGRPFLEVNHTGRIVRQLTEARKILRRADGDAEYALKLAQAALDASDLPEGKRGEAAFLAGSALVRIAEKAEPL